MKIRALLVLSCLFLAGCLWKTELYSNLTEREANKMLAVLLDSGIVATKKSSADGASILVNENQFARSMSLLEARGLPSDNYTSLGEVFQKEGIVSSPIEERARYIYALSQELSQTISEIDGVLNARVMVNLPETDMLGRSEKTSSASVAIVHAHDAQVEARTPSIKLLVANSIEGLVYDNVSVVLFPSAATNIDRGVAPPLQQFAGILVHPGSVSRLQMMLGGMGALAVFGVAFGITSLMRKNSKTQPEPSEASELL